MTDTDDTGTDVSDVDSTESASGAFQPEQLNNQHKPPRPADSKHQYNKTGSMVIKHRTNSSLGNHLDLVNRMVSRWGSMGDGELDAVADDLETDSDYDEIDENGNKIKIDENGNKTVKQKQTPPDASNGTDAAATTTTTTTGGGLDAPPPKKGGHRRKKSAQDEMMLLKSEQEALEKAFDQYIDPDGNEDVDVEEWQLGLEKLNVQLNEAMSRRIFAFMDKDKSGYIERNDFVIFCTSKFDTEELQALQMPILESVRIQNLHNRTHSNLMNAQLSQDWTDYDMDLLQQEMASAMNTMVDSMKEELTHEAEFKNEMVKRIEENPEILNRENAAEWTEYEVVHWIEQMGMERYARYFAQENVDGAMLLEDVDEDLLTSNLGVRSIHAKKIMREINNLKRAVRGVTDILLDQSDFICSHNIEDISLKIQQVAIKQELEKTKRQKDQLKKFYEGEMQKLMKQIADLKEEVANSGKKGKKKKKKDKAKNKDKNKKEQTFILPQPPLEEESTSSLFSPDFSLGAALVPTESDEIKDDDNKEIMNDEAPTMDANGDQNENENENENGGDVVDKMVSADNDNETQEETKEEAQDEAIEDAPISQPSTEQQQARSSMKKSRYDDSSDDDDSEEDEDSDESESDEDDGRRILGMKTSYLMQLKRKKSGPSPRQINKFLKDLSKKKEQLGDKFCFEDVDTIMEWTSEEVAYWIMSINFEQYAFAFYSSPIDGDMLIRDMNKESIIEDLGVMKIHSNRILRAIDKLRKIINEGFDEDINEGISIEPDLERPTMDQIESLQERIEKLQQEREDIMKELESKDDGDEEGGFFTQKIQDLETERNEMKETNEKLENDMNELKSDHEAQIENLNNTLNEANAGNDELRKEIKGLKKDLRKAKRQANGDEDYEDEEEEEEEEEEEKEAEKDEPIEIRYSKEQIEQEIRKEMDENMSFGMASNVLMWTPAETCNWLKNLQFTPYMTVFYSAQIFGDVLTQDIGSRMLKKFKVTSMHIPKLLRNIHDLRKQAEDQGVEISLSEEVKNEINGVVPEQKKKQKKEKKGGKGGKKLAEVEKLLSEERERLDELQRDVKDKEDLINEYEEKYEEENKLRIGYELELEQVKDQYDDLMQKGSKQQIEHLQNLVSSIEESKIRTVRDLNDQLHNLRVGCRLMQKEIAYLKTKVGFHPIDSLVGVLGYSQPPKY